MERSNAINESDIAVIGMAGRFPGASDIDSFWRNLRDGIESISFFSDQELLQSFVAPEMIRHPDYVRAGGALSGIEMFDADFFNFSPKEAAITDPQIRLFLECAWESLETAGYNPHDCGGSVGVFTGKSMSTYLTENLQRNPDILDSTDFYQLLISNGTDFLSTRTSYKLNLTGPSIGVQTACSTSLVAVHMACQSLLAGECDMALAGGATVSAVQKRGYLYQKDMVASPDGHCRAFDANAQGTVGGNGVGVVVLKPIVQAIEDRDHIYSVIKGSAVNNDGLSKIGYTAPSINGQVDVIAEAQAVSEIDADTISFIEAHGTGTKLGDPVEIAALTQVFRNQTGKKNFCAIGSLKTNVGHLDAAAGVASLIKTVLSLHHRMLPPSLHFETPNPDINFADSPFYVNDRLRDWKNEGETPLRAGVSSFGIGGTNVHVILEEAPIAEIARKQREYHLLILSAKTDSALNQTLLNLAEHFKQNPDIDLSDVAYTLCVGRKAFQHRAFLVCRDVKEAIEKIASGQGVFNGYHESEEALVNDEQLSELGTESELAAIGRSWIEGKRIDLERLYKDGRYHRIPLPTYPFERRRYWVEARSASVVRDCEKPKGKKPDIEDWFYVPSWKRLPLAVDKKNRLSGNVLLFVDNEGIGMHLADRLGHARNVSIVREGKAFEKQRRNVYGIDPGDPDHYKALMADLSKNDNRPETVLHMWSLTREPFSDFEHIDKGLAIGCHSLSFLAQALGEQRFTDPLRMIVITNGVLSVTGEEILHPVKAAILGAVKIIPLEYQNIACRSLDVVIPQEGELPEKELTDRILEELTEESGVPAIALRGAYRWVQIIEPIKLEASEKYKVRLRENGVYLITGGLGGIGLTLAEHLAKTVKARLILIGHSDFPERDRWKDWLAEHGEQNKVSRRIKKIEEMETAGAEVIPITADVADPIQMLEATNSVLRSIDRLDGVVHSAGIADTAGIIQKRTKSSTEAVLAPKIKGTLLLDDAIKGFKPDFFILCSSLATVHFKSQFGQSAYVAANEFLDAFAHHKFLNGDRFITTVNWDVWQEVGMAVAASEKKGVEKYALQYGISPPEGVELFNRILGNRSPRFIVSTRELVTNDGHEPPAGKGADASLVKREAFPALPPPHGKGSISINEIERILTNIWQECLGIGRIETDDDFFELGGDSLLGTQITSRILEQLGINLHSSILFEERTLAGLSKHIEDTLKDMKRAKNLSNEAVREGRERLSL